MKIAIYNVTTSFQLGGIETYCVEMGAALSQLGHEITQITGLHNRQYTNELKNVRYFKFTPREKFIDLGNRFKKLMERLSFGKNSYRHLMDHGYDAIIITKPYDFPLVWLLKKRGYKGLIIFHTGGTDFFRSDRFFSSAVDFFIACSEYTGKQNSQHYSRKFHVIPNGVNTEMFSPKPTNPEWRKKFNIPRDAPLIMTVGRIVGWKGLETIVQAIVQIPDVYYLYIGKGPHEKQLLELAQTLSITHRLRSAGALPHDRIPEVMQQADIFAQPSIGEEAFGITVIEAMACGLPVIASDQGGMREIITHQKDGLLLPPGDINAWELAIRDILQKPDQQTSLMAHNARNTAVERFTWASVSAQLDALIRS